MFGTPVVAIRPDLGEVIGADPYDDATDTTYVRAISRSRLPEAPGDGFCHINASVDTAAFSDIPAVTVRASATGVNALAARATMNLYAPGDIYALPGATLNLSAGSAASYVDIPVDGVIRDIPVTIYDWETEVPATLAQINAYFAAGGTLSARPAFNGTTGGSGPFEVDVRIYRITVGSMIDPTISYRRIFPRDDALGAGSARTFPRPRSTQGSNRTSGGYL